MQELGGNWLLMGHTENLDTCSRQVVGGDPRQVSKIVYCGYHQEGQWLQKILVLKSFSFILLQVTYWSHCSIAMNMMENGMEMEELLIVGAPQLLICGWAGQVSLSRAPNP